ncbi:MAG: hypothetical protein J6R81_04980 [Alistipes sp.]|nr:hypothetical protein [Alistipes sp.]
MAKLGNILLLVASVFAVACIDIVDVRKKTDANEIVATVDGVTLTRTELRRDIPAGLVGADSVTFSRMYIDNWVLKQLKMRRAEEVLSSNEADIERLVEGYRQSLIMRQLDQYYIDHAIDPEISEREIVAHYRANGARYKLDHNKVRGVVVKTPRSFRNTATLSTALRNVVKRGTQEVEALAEKHSLQLSDMTAEWVSYSDFLSHLPTVRTRSYEDLLSKSGVQQMSTDDANFYFIITEVVRRGEVSPLECVAEDIRRVLYAERRSAIVGRYEAEMLREAASAGRIIFQDSLLLDQMIAGLPAVEPTEVVEQRDSLEDVDERIFEEADSLSLGI